MPDPDGERGEAEDNRIHPRRVRALEPGERGDLAERLDPDVPGPCIDPPPLEGNGFNEIDKLGAWQCALNPFTSMASVPGHLQAKWGKIVAEVLRLILTAQGGRFPRVFGDKIGDKFGEQFGDSLNLVKILVTNSVTKLVNHQIW